MPTIYKILGQAAPGANVGAVLYTVPTTGNAVISTLIAMNASSSAATFRVLVRSGSTHGIHNHIAYDAAVPPNDTVIMTLGITLSGSCQLVVSGSTANVGFSAFGSEIT